MSLVDRMPETQPFASVAETHTGAVFFFGDRAYKAKKPVAFDFLDFTRLETRREACYKEFELNSRLAPDVYLGVAKVLGASEEVLDHLVVMRRLPAERRLSTLVTAGEGVELHLRRLARLLADFHARAERSTLIDAAGRVDEVFARWQANETQFGRLDESVGRFEWEEHVNQLAARYVTGRRRLFEQRIADGFICDGHGDLLADDIFCLADGPRVLDCLEFDDRLRYGDVLQDVAFLAMDLERLGHPGLAASFLEQYRLHSAQTWPASLQHYYVAYRAQVRCLVAAIRHQQGDRASEEMMTRLMEICASHLEHGQVRLVVVGGLPGSGKSTLALRLASTLDAVVLRSDEIRKQAAGLDVTARGDRALYSAARSTTTYETMLGQAEICLSMGQSVVLDATFVEPLWREAVRSLAERGVAELSELRCTAPTGLLEQRVKERPGQGDHVSDATVEIVRALTRSEGPWQGACEINTSGSVDDAYAKALETIIHTA